MKPEDLEKIGQENSILLGNHRYEIDWLLGWVFTQRFGLVGVSFFFNQKKKFFFN
jgi:lysophosphatidic acid acyltransferase/lysophosphatidylinositol acyltransferase